MNGKPLDDKEIRDLLVATLHGGLPKETMHRVFMTLAEVPGLRAVRVAAAASSPFAGASVGATARWLYATYVVARGAPESDNRWNTFDEMNADSQRAWLGVAKAVLRKE